MRKNRNEIDAFYLRHFKIFPDGITQDSFHDLLPIQKEYIMLLTASAPSLDAWSAWMQYSDQLEDIEAKNYFNDIKTSDAINEIAARAKGLSLREYKEQLCEEMRQEDIKILNEKFGVEVPKEEVEDVRAKVLNKYNEIADRLESNSKTKKMDAVDKLFQNPTIKEEDKQ